MTTNPAREEILGKVRVALKRTASSSVAVIPATARIPSRAAADVETELALFLAEVEKLSGKTKRLKNKADLEAGLREMVAAEAIKKATVWQTPELKELGVEDVLRSIGVEVVSPYAPHHVLAECDLGVTGADFALPETGTLVLRSSIAQPRAVSLLPRVHLVLMRPKCLRADLHQVFEETRHAGYSVFVTGSSRTSDIELTLTLGVHGPKMLAVMVLP